MKSLTAICQQTAAGGAASMPAINSSGRISRPTHPHRGDGENAEMKMYLSKLKDLVPFMPKNRKLSKLEIIQHVIDYICDLQSELETHPEISNFDAAAALHLAATVGDSANGDSGSDNHQEQNEGESSTSSSSLQRDNNSSRLVAASTEDNHQQQQQSSPVVRQPLAARQSPNTILPASHQLPHHLYPASSHLISSNGINHQLQASNSANETTEIQKQNASSSSWTQC